MHHVRELKRVGGGGRHRATLRAAKFRQRAAAAAANTLPPTRNFLARAVLGRV
jgi:hypothetical protein